LEISTARVTDNLQWIARKSIFLFHGLNRWIIKVSVLCACRLRMRTAVVDQSRSKRIRKMQKSWCGPDAVYSCQSDIVWVVRAGNESRRSEQEQQTTERRYNGKSRRSMRGLGRKIIKIFGGNSFRTLYLVGQPEPERWGFAKNELGTLDIGIKQKCSTHIR